jgi:tRNA-uridine 2-sulfurtransferase
MPTAEYTDDFCRRLVDPRWIGKRVAVAMSGGVDSSVAAVILAKAGCDVIGVTMKLWDFADVGGDAQRDGQCCTVDAFNRCRAVADRYGFPHYTLDFTSRFASDVIDYFVSEYRQARTPNPCIVCNSRVRWPALWERMAALGCEAIATGHYAKLSLDGDGDVDLRRAADASRDQTYFLWDVGHEYFRRTIFPLGTLLKPHIRDLARAWNLPTAETPESRDICFVADGDLSRFMSERNTLDSDADTSGPIIDQTGTVLGHHKGFESYTIGQRKGLGVAVGRPQYVTRIDPATGSVEIGDDADLLATRCRIGKTRWLAEVEGDRDDLRVQIRYRHQAAPARVRTVSSSDSAIIEFTEPQRAITPGQSAVVYAGDRVLGGGVIESVGE